MTMTEEKWQRYIKAEPPEFVDYPPSRRRC